MRSLTVRKIYSTFLATVLIGLSWSAFAEEQPSGASMTDIVAGVQKLCGGTGSGVDLTVTGEGQVQTSKAVSLVVNGKLAGVTTFSKSEWDGVRAMREDSRSYAQCVQNLTPLFVDKFSKKKSSG